MSLSTAFFSLNYEEPRVASAQTRTQSVKVTSKKLTVTMTTTELLAQGFLGFLGNQYELPIIGHDGYQKAPRRLQC